MDASKHQHADQHEAPYLDSGVMVQDYAREY